MDAKWNRARWPTRYTGKTIHFVRGARTSSAVQIDHVVALENAWRSGANQWDRTKRYRFGNDMYNLLAVDGAGQSGEGLRVGRVLAADERRIPCDYVARQIGVKAKYGLTVTTKESGRCCPYCVPARRRPCRKSKDDRKYGLFADVTGYANETWSAGGTHLNRPYIATFARLRVYAHVVARAITRVCVVISSG
mgnify:CR=1 FL=1